MKKFFKFAAVAAIAAMFVSCTEKPGPDPEKPNNQEPETPKVEITENIAFTLEVTEVEIDKAKVKVEHNGTTKDTWYAFATTDTDVNKAVTAKVAELTADGGKISGLKKNTSTTITVRSLEQDTDYTFIAFAITPEGELYGTAASTTFKTEKEEVVPPAPEGMTVNPNWTVTYIGDYEEGGKVYDNVVVVETTDTNPFFVTAWPVDYYEELGIEAIVEEEIKAWEEMLAQYPGATWNDIVYTESILAQVSIEPEYGTKWYAMAIGCDTNGKTTGLYALSEVIDLENLGGGDDSGDNGGDDGDDNEEGNGGNDNEGNGGIFTDGEFVLVADAAELTVGDSIVIVYENYVMGKQTDKYRAKTDVVTSNGKVTYMADDAQIVVLEEGRVAGTYALNVGNGYLAATSSSSNHVITTTTLNADASWKITIDGNALATIKAQGSYARNTLQYNTSAPRFSCYKSGQKSVNIYAKSPATTDIVDIEDGGTVDVYTITGVVVRKGVDPSDALQDLPRGVYIVGGKKCLIK